MRLHFHGAIQTVTGSLHLVETSKGEFILLDCGLFQGRRSEARQRNTTLPIPPKRVAAVVLSHAHIDHTGNLPTWVSQGLNCPVFATSATVDLTGLMLRDSAHIQMLDTAYINKKLRRNHEPDVLPLYTPEHAEAAIAMLRPVKYREWFQVRPGIRVFLTDAGHILGSTSVTLEESTNGTRKRMVFTGDVGRPNTPILRDPEPPASGADLVITESTYGNRDHPSQAELPEELRKVIYATISRRGKVLIPAFAVGRTQSVLYALRQLQKAGKLPEIPVFVDSPLACAATEVIQRHSECYDTTADEVLRDDGHLFAVEGYTCVRGKEESQRLNDRREPCIIIAASGMCEAGRIVHHLAHGLEDDRNTILIVGFQADHTLGYKLVKKTRFVRIFGQDREVRAQITVLAGFSAHAGQHELLGFLDRCRPAGPVFVVHGDAERTAAFKTCLDQNGFPDVRIPMPGDEYKW